MNHGPGLTFRFLAAQVLVVVISLLVAAAVAKMVGPTLFHDHMLMTGREDPSLELFHAEQAYRDANLITLVLASSDTSSNASTGGMPPAAGTTAGPVSV